MFWVFGLIEGMGLAEAWRGDRFSPAGCDRNSAVVFTPEREVTGDSKNVLDVSISKPEAPPTQTQSICTDQQLDTRSSAADALSS